MTGGRWALFATGLMMVAAAVVFLLIQHDQVAVVAAVLSAVVAIAGLGVAVWAALRKPAGPGRRCECGGLVRSSAQVLG
ncbi:hypothetical protein [Micromonospora sp. NPDC005806]|uniref:hypothetical protein n=1 Tax=Micromonospora sp. NPDC005806 TaxID=3364234 RepID=UPI00368DE41F